MTDSLESDLNPLTGNYVDLQINGYVGVDFNDPRISLEEIIEAARAIHRDGVRWALPTIITASMDVMICCLKKLVDAIEADAEVAQVFVGIHIEGPFLSPEPGFIGAHPVQHALAADSRALDELLDAGRNWVRLVTLAPEIDAQAKLTRSCVERGIAVAAGHTDASLEQLERTLDAGLSLFTHLGNGCPHLLDRHDNIIQRALRFAERLKYSLIADGHHLPEVLFRNLLEWVPVDNLMVVSDAISAAGLGPGKYPLGGRQIQVSADKCAWDASGRHFVGAASSMRDADSWLAGQLGLERKIRSRLLVDNPEEFLSRILETRHG